VKITVEDVERITGEPFAATAHRCHAVSLAIVKSGILPDGARVARGTCRGVPSQHSWIVVGDPYALGVPIIDPTLWSCDPTVKGVWHGRATNRGRHISHGGAGSIWSYGKPVHSGGETVPLTPAAPLSSSARAFLDLLGPLDRRGWMMLADAPVLGWPAAEIIGAMVDTKGLCALVPIDRVGMLTDRNPGGLYQ
jgi:hypothetical protein